jgi:hypothetical protein
MALTQLLGGPDWDVQYNLEYALFADFHYFFNSGSIIRSNPWNSPQTPVAKTIKVTNITANDVALNYINTSGSIVATTLSGSESRTIISQTIPLGLDNSAWLSASFIENHTGSVIARPTGSRFFEMAGIRTIAQSTNMYTIADGATTITKTSLSSPVSGSSFRYACSRTIPYLDQPFWLIRDIDNCSGGTTTTTSTTTTTAGPTTTTTSTTTTGPNFIQYLVVAGGGGGGYSNNTSTRAGGGGAGGWLTGSATITYSSTPITVTVGTGGAGGIFSTSTNSANGGNTAFYDLVADGGGRGGVNGTTPQLNGGNGGSGGGATTGATAGTGIAGEGFNGSNGTGSPTTRGGSGGGAAGAATSTQAGSGKQWLDGNYYAAGGRGDNATTATNGAGTKGSGGNGSLNANGENGQDGIVIIRYQGIPRATGGTITNVGGYTYHTFTSSGNFTFNGVTSTTTSTTTTAGPTTTLASQKYYIESCSGPGDIVGIITITNAPTLNAGDVIRLNTNIAGLSCFTVFSTSTGTPTLGTRSVTNIWPGADCGNCSD